MAMRLNSWASSGLAIMLAVVGGIVLADSVSAVARGPLNAQEQTAYGQTWLTGVIWMGDSNSFANGGAPVDGVGSNYHRNVIDISATQTEATVYIHGSAYMGPGSTPFYNQLRGLYFFAQDVEVTGANRSLLTLYGNSFLRGRFDRDLRAGRWTNQQRTVRLGGTTYNGYLAGRLDVRNIARTGPMKNNYIEEKIQVGLYRCPLYRNASGQVVTIAANRCGTEDMTITVRRGPMWSVSPSSYAAIGQHTAAPGANWSATYQQRPSQAAEVGDKITFYHRVANTSPRTISNLPAYAQTFTVDSLSPGHNSGEFSTGVPNKWNPPGVALTPRSYTPAPAMQEYHPAKGDVAALVYTVKSSDAGKYVCQRLGLTADEPSLLADPKRYRLTAAACVKIHRTYQLRPTVDLPIDTLQEGERRVDGVRAGIVNDGPSVSNRAHYAVIRFAVKGREGATIGGGENIRVPHDPRNPANLIPDWACAVVWGVPGMDRASCTGQELVRDGSGRLISPPGLSIPGSPFHNDIERLQLKKGDQLCYATVVSGYRAAVDDSTFRYAVDCAVVAAKPKVQAWGGDIRTDKDIKTSITTLSAGGDRVMYGSWGEYGLRATGEITSASGAGLASSGSGVPWEADAIRFNQLTFANTQRRLGLFGRAPAAPPIEAHYTVQERTGSTSIGALQSKVYGTVSHISLQGGTVPAGRRVVIKATGTVTVTSDIIYHDGPYSDLRQVPQVVIIADAIVVTDSVKRIDAWLIARRGQLSTCGWVRDSAKWLDGLNVAACGQQLQLNGPVVVERLYLRRTFSTQGDTPERNPGSPAEVVNLRPDAYLYGYDHSHRSGAMRTMYARELPPRF